MEKREIGENDWLTGFRSLLSDVQVHIHQCQRTQSSKAAQTVVCVIQGPEHSG